MRRPKFRLALCAAGLAAALAGGALALGNGDSLISLSYLTDTFLPSAQSQLEEIQNDAMQEAYDQAAAQLQGGTGTSGLYSADFQSRTFSQGDTITLSTGSGLMIYGGTGELAHSGAVIDVTDGTTVPSGTRLTVGHRYLVGEDTSAALAVRSGVMYLGLQGSYTFTDSGKQSLPFVDVAQGDWYESAVEYAYTNGLFSGTSADAFSPNLTMNRAMLVTVLYRLAGSPEEELNSAQASFWDVAADSWYAPYVRWGYVQGVTAGTGEGSFGPEQQYHPPAASGDAPQLCPAVPGAEPHRRGGSVPIQRRRTDGLLGPGGGVLGGGQPAHRPLQRRDHQAAGPGQPGRGSCHSDEI